MTDTLKHPLSRRAFFASSGAAALTLSASSSARADGHGDAMQYEVVHTEEEWRARLDEFQFHILRGGNTEPQKFSPLWEETRPGDYHCHGCDLKSYEGNWKVVLDKGWVFFEHAVLDAVLFGLDGPVAEYGQMASSDKVITEVHCRRCAGHLGHHVLIGGQMLHCINGTALNYKPLEA